MYDTWRVTSSAGNLCGCHGIHSHSHVPQAVATCHFLQSSQQIGKPSVGRNICREEQQQMHALCWHRETSKTVELFRNSVLRIRTARHPGVILDMLLIWSAGIRQDRIEASQRLNVLSPCLVKRIWPFFRNGVLDRALKQLLNLVTKYACFGISAALIHVGKFHLLQFSYLRIATDILVH